MRLTPEEQEKRDREIRRLRQEGASLNEIARAVGLSQGGVTHAINRMKLPIKYRNELKVESDKLAADLSRAGKGPTEIAEIMGVDNRVVRNRLSKLGVIAAKAKPRRTAPKSDAYAKAFASGLSLDEIATQFGVAKSSVASALYLRKKRMSQV